MQVFANVSSTSADSFKEIPLKFSATGDWGEPAKMPTVKDLIEALSKIEDKNLPVTIADGANGHDALGLIKRINVVKADEDVDESLFFGDQVLIGIVQ